MDEIIRRAELLGELIRRNERFAELRAAEAQADADKEATELLEKLNKQLLEISRKERSQEPIEVEEKHVAQDLSKSVASNPALKRLSKAQADFAELMSRVNAAIRSKMLPDERQPAPDES